MKTESEKVRILFVEDDPNLSMVLQDYLEMIGYSIRHAKNGVEGFNYFMAEPFDLLILDVMLPKKDGFSLAADVRASNQSVPIIFLTAKSLKEDRIKGFQQGCDDYITKPFSTEELSLRIKAILKRCAVPGNQYRTGTPELFVLGKYEFDSGNMMLRCKGVEDKRLTRKEADLLKLLCINKNNILPREVALETIWGENNYFIGRSMDVFIAKLRKYLKADPNVRIINVHGIGFKLEIRGELVQR